MINDKSNIHIQGWMMKLGLNLTELMIYATIYSFTNGTSDHCYRGSAMYLGERSQIQKRSVYRILNKLEKKGLIQRKERYINWVRFIDYYTDYGDATKVTGDDASVIGDDIMSSGEMTPVSSNNNRVYNNSISISNDIDNISYPPLEKTSITTEQTQPLGPLPEPVGEFLKDSYNKYPSTKYQIDKQWSKYFMTTIKDFEKLCQEYGKETVYTVLNFIKQDDFRCRQIQSIGKLRKKNKDWIPYMIVIMEKLQQSKPKIIDLDQYK